MNIKRDKKVICYDGSIVIGHDSRDSNDVLKSKSRLSYRGAVCQQYEDEEGRR